MRQSARINAQQRYACVLTVLLSVSCCLSATSSAGIIGGVQTAIVQGEYFPQDDKSRRSILSGVLVACLLLGAFVGCFIAVWLGNKRGMRFSFRVAALNCVIMSILMAVVPGFELLVLFRTLLGLSIGFACALVPWYVTDSIPAATRGSIGTIFQIGICAFILVSQIINYVRHFSKQHRCMHD